MRGLRLAIRASAVTLFCFISAANAAEICPSPVGHIASVQGAVTIHHEPRRPRVAQLDDRLCPGDRIDVGDRSRAAIVLLDDGVIRIDQNSTLMLARIEPDEPSLLELVFGQVYFFSRRSRALDVDTPFVNAAVEGTEFVVGVTADRAQVTVYEGQVTAANDRGTLSLGAGQSALARDGAAPIGVLLVRPRDAVQWAVHYPPILFTAPGRGSKSTRSM